jgi:hypothetical protein
MSEEFARSLVSAVGGYAAFGVAFAIAFVTVGVGRVDPAAKGAPWTFRLLVFPGAAALWPFLAWRWARGGAPPAEHNAHRDAARTAP